MAITIKTIKRSDSDSLSEILSLDILLNTELSGNANPTKVSAEDFYSKTTVWAKKNNAKCYVINYDNEVVGMISLSHIDKKSSNANIGYWISSNYWGKGVGTSAFREILDEARKMGITKVHASIPIQSIASQRIWQKHNAAFKKDGDLFTVTIELT